MERIVDNPKKVPLKQFLLILDLLNKEKKSLVYVTPDDIFGHACSFKDYEGCIRRLTEIEEFWTRNEQTTLYYIWKEESSNGILLSVSISLTNRKIENFNMVL